MWVLQQLKKYIFILIFPKSNLQSLATWQRFRTGQIYFLVFLLTAFTSCHEEFTPKPKGYNRIDLPAPKYKPLTDQHPYFFEYSAYTKILRDSFSVATADWINIYYPQFNANIQLTYRPVNNDRKVLNALLEDARKLTVKHQIKAEAIETAIIRTDIGLHANIAELSGEVPSQFHFYVTDSTKHFFRGALYFRTATANDSLAPVIDYIKKDILHMLNTLEWRQNKIKN